MQIELLSPARDLACGIAAIDHGADAVYIGAPRFGARAAAGNSVDDIRTLCDYAHCFGARIYVTLNTLLHPEEREPARLLAWELYRAGVDALIVQDTYFRTLPVDDNGSEGEVSPRDKALPPIPLHASTQMDNRTAEQVAQLRDLGYEQVVLARELTLEEIREIHEAVPDVALEAFVHGALCVSYSGRCYASEYCFGRSANRGECAQFCRLPFSLQDADGRTLVGEKYLLSLRDMNRIAYLEEMLDAGVRSFKIEGRLKDIAYVKNVTAAYCQALDSIMQRRPEFVRSSFGTSAYTFTPDLSRSFSRGSTDYFLHGRTDDLASPDTPKSRGREVGRVKEVRGGCVIVSSTEVFTSGDGLCFFDRDGHLQGFRVNRAEGNHLYVATAPHHASPAIGKLRKGDLLWRSFDQQWERLMSAGTAERRIAARFLFEDTKQGFRLTFTADDGTSCAKEFALEHQAARTDQSASIRDVLSRLGDSPYVCRDVEVRFSQPWFIPRSTLAEWRRDVMEEGRRKREEGRGKSESGMRPSLPCSLIPNPYSPSPLMTCRFCLRHAWGQCKKDSPRRAARNEEWRDPLYLVSRDGRRFRLHFDCRRCEMTVNAE